MSVGAAEVLARMPYSASTVLDAHAHTGPYSLFFIPDHDPAAMVRVMDRCGVSVAVLSSHLSIQLDAREGNTVTAEAVDAFPARFRGYFTVNPWQDPAREVALLAEDHRFSGIKLHPDLHAYPVDGRRYAAVWELAEATGIPVLTHTWAESPYCDVARVEAVVDRHPHAVVLAGHAGGFGNGFDDAVNVAERHPNLVLEICGSHLRGDLLSEMVDRVGAAQVVFGSDFPFIDLRISLGRVLFARLSDEDREAVLGGTMSRLLEWRAKADVAAAPSAGN